MSEPTFNQLTPCADDFKRRPIVAFLQNLWVKDVARIEQLFLRHPNDREDILRRLLFRGGKTGKILKGILGEELAKKIVWEESTTKIAGDSTGVFPADLSHIRKVLNKHRPEIVICFGKIASRAVFLVSNGMAMEPSDFKFEAHYLPHPCARPPADPIGYLIELKQKLSHYIQ